MARVRVTNTGDRAGADVVQLYGRDVVGSVTRPVAQLLGYHRVHLEAGESVEVTFTVPTTRLAFSDRSGRRVVEPGELQVWAGAGVRRPGRRHVGRARRRRPRRHPADERWTSTQHTHSER